MWRSIVNILKDPINRFFIGMLLLLTLLKICPSELFLFIFQMFELDCHDAVNCCCFLSDVCVACGTQDGHITVTDIRKYK